MDPSEKRGSQQKKSRKLLSTSKGSVGAPATACTRTVAPPPGSLGVGSGALPGGTGAGAPSSGSGSSNHQAPGAFWTGVSPGSSFMGDPSSFEWLYPPGGFVDSLHMPYPYASQLPENFHFIGGPSTRRTPSPKDGTEARETIDVDGDESPEPARTDRRLNWSHEEDIRLASAWLHNSLDLVDGNDKKSDKYWADVTDTYNNTTPSNRRRNRNQLKIRWDRIKKPVSEFHGCWVRATRVFASGESDDQRTDEAQQIYASGHNDKPFLLQHIWRVVRHERKWAAYLKKLNKEKGSPATPANVVSVEDYSPKERPIGHKRAKEERNGKRKTPEAISAIGDKLDKFIEASTKVEKMTEVQQSLANKKLEVTKLNHKAAQEHTKGKMLNLYKDLLCGSTSDLNEEAMAERSKALECMRLALFANPNWGIF